MSKAPLLSACVTESGEKIPANVFVLERMSVRCQIEREKG